MEDVTKSTDDLINEIMKSNSKSSTKIEEVPILKEVKSDED